MKNIMIELEKRFDKKWIKENIINLYRIERLQTFPAYIKSAHYVYNLLKEEGFEAELVNIPADGKTIYQDARMPIGWDVKEMRLTLLTKVDGIENGVLADYSINPCSAVKHSVATPQEGLETLLVSEDDFKNGADVSGCFVLFNRDTRPGRNGNIREILNAGAIGWVSDFCENQGDTPEYTAWLNSGTETGSWHAQADDRDFIGYQITPKHGDCLRAAYKKSKIYVKAYSDAKRYESVLPFVSALLPGESKKEIWVMAHMYEPLIDDNPNGVIGSIAILKILRDLIREDKYRLKYSVRLVFASEFYGFASAAEYYGGVLSERTIAGINMDGLPASVEKGKYREWRMLEAPDYPVNAANIIFHEVENTAKNIHPDYIFSTYPAKFGDDQALGDNTIGLPIVWFLRGSYNCFHHNSILSEEFLDIDVFVDTLVLSGTWICSMATFSDFNIRNILPNVIQRSQKLLNDAAVSKVRAGCDVNKRMEFLYEREKKRIIALTDWADIPEVYSAAESLVFPCIKNVFVGVKSDVLDKMDNYVFKRVTRGLPMDMTRISDVNKQYKRGLFIYFPIASVLPRIDGVHSLKEIIEKIEWSNDIIVSDLQIEEYLEVCNLLAKSGYISILN